MDALSIGIRLKLKKPNTSCITLDVDHKYMCDNCKKKIEKILLSRIKQHVDTHVLNHGNYKIQEK